MRPATIHDRRSTDTLAAGQYAAIEVDDPYEQGEKIVVLRQLRSDPLARLHSHHQIDDAQYHAGRCYQRDWEVAERGESKAPNADQLKHHYQHYGLAFEPRAETLSQANQGKSDDHGLDRSEEPLA